MAAQLTQGQVFVARQPILNPARRVCAYELLFHSASPGDEQTLSDAASARVISDALLAIGLDTLTSDRRAFINVGRRLLLEGIPSILPPERVVIELSADIEADAEVLTACAGLRKAGYAIAVDDFSWNEWTTDLVPIASFLKLDIRSESHADVRARIHQSRGANGPALIASHVETTESFDQAVAHGCTYFQGFFFGRPLVVQGRDVPVHQLANLQLLRALHDPNLSVHQLENLIKHDAALCYRILRTVNSAAFALQTTVSSIRQALLLLGRDTVRRWASLWVLAGLSTDANAELVVMSTVRARCCEVLAGKASGDDAASEGFLLGICSLLDSILARPMSVVLEGLPVAESTRAALRGEDNEPRRLLDCVIAYEQGQWKQSLELAKLAKVNPVLLPIAHADALRWAHELQKAEPQKKK